MMSPDLQAVLLALGAAVLFAVALMVTQSGLRHMDAPSGALVSLPCTTALFWALAPLALRPWPDVSALPAAALGIFAAVGVGFPAFVTMLVFQSNAVMGPSATATISSIAPLIAIGAALAVLGEPLRATVLAGALAIVAGVILVASTGGGRRRTWPLLALLLPLGAATIRGGAQTAAKLGLQLLPSPFIAALVGYSVSTLSVVLVLGLAAAVAPRWRPRVNARGAPWFALAGLCNGSAVFISYAALRLGSVSLVAPLLATYPLITLLLDALLERPLLDTLQLDAPPIGRSAPARLRVGRRLLLGTLLVVGGVALVVA